MRSFTRPSPRRRRAAQATSRRGALLVLALASLSLAACADPTGPAEKEDSRAPSTVYLGRGLG